MRPSVKVLLALVAAAAVLVPASVVSPLSGVSAAAEAVVTFSASDGRSGATIGSGQGADQGEDQGENIGQFASGRASLGPTTVRSDNAAVSGSASGGLGGDVDVTINNFVTTTCSSGATTAAVSMPSLTLRAGNGGRGGSSGTGQGEDQAEDQGENVGQFATATVIGPTTVDATNRIVAGPARGGDGGDVSVVFNQHITCVSAGTRSPAPSPSSTVHRDAMGNVVGTIVTHRACSEAGQAYTFRAGDGGPGGSTGAGQGSDQAEDQGENIGQFAAGSSTAGPVLVRAANQLTSRNVTGSRGGHVNVTFNNYIDGGCAAPVGSSSPVVVSAGSGGRGGESGTIQGIDQAEDQGENIGRYASHGAVIGPVTVLGTNSILSGDASGGDGGRVDISYNDFGSCAAGAEPAGVADERVTATGGAGGVGGSSGRGQGEDQGEDQGENIGQYASNGTKMLGASVVANNSNTAGNANGGQGGGVVVTFKPDTCGPPNGAFQTVSGSAGHGADGGSSGAGQGADQGEDQGENIGQWAAPDVQFGAMTVQATNTNVSGDVFGGNGGGVLVTPATPCATPDPPPDRRVSVAPGRGGQAGATGVGQGADQGEDQGENIGEHSESDAKSATVTAQNTNTVGRALDGLDGVVSNLTCAAVVAAQRSAPPVPLDVTAAQAATPGPEQVACNEALHGSVSGVIVYAGAVCTLTRGTRVDGDVQVLPGGALIADGAVVAHGISAYRATRITITGGSVGHDLSIAALVGGAGQNRICGVQVGHELAVNMSTKAAGAVVVGGPAPCGGNAVGGAITLVGNAGGVTGSRNRTSDGIRCHANAPVKGAMGRARSGSCVS